MALMDNVVRLPLDDVDPLDMVVREERRSENLEKELIVVVGLDCASEKRYMASSTVGVSGKPSGVGARGLIRSVKSSVPRCYDITDHPPTK